MGAIADTVLVGVGATAFMDLWSIVRWRAFGVPAPDYGLVGRWLAHMRHGRFRHQRIAAAPAQPGELAIGWCAHYLTGIAYAAALVGAAGPGWLQEPRPGPALLVGLVTVAAPFLLMQPGMGLGVAARLAPRPGIARVHTLVTHSVFGVGLYAAAMALGSIS